MCDEQQNLVIMDMFRRLDFNIKGTENIQERTVFGGLGECWRDMLEDGHKGLVDRYMWLHVSFGL